jgi:hypothetical protein
MEDLLREDLLREDLLRSVSSAGGKGGSTTRILERATEK